MIIIGQPARDETEFAAAERVDHAARLLRDGVGARPRPVGRYTPSQVGICYTFCTFSVQQKEATRGEILSVACRTQQEETEG